MPSAEGMPAIVLVVGVNGTGKTTTIGKLAARERASSRRVVLAAADTFRAAAIDQLRIWAQRTDSEIVAHKPGRGPGRRCLRRAGRRDRAPRRHRDRRHRRPPAHQVEPHGRAVQDPPHDRQADPRGRRGDILRPRRHHRPERARPGEGIPHRGGSHRCDPHQAGLAPRRAASCSRSSGISGFRCASLGWGSRRTTCCPSTRRPLSRRSSTRAQGSHLEPCVAARRPGLRRR